MVCFVGWVFFLSKESLRDFTKLFQAACRLMPYQLLKFLHIKGKQKQSLQSRGWISLHNEGTVAHFA